MNKVICDVCGTTYPETASQCPICGCAKPENAEIVAADGIQSEAAAGTYSHTKGGHFSKSNVRKRNKIAAAPVVKASSKASKENGNSEESNKGLVIAIVLLILAILAMLCYIYFTYFSDGLFGSKSNEATTTAPSVSESLNTTPTTEPVIKCTALELSDTVLELDAVGNAWLLNVTATPNDTTDKIIYSTSDPNVATVTSEGRVTAVGAGTAVITITCGDITAECKVTCDIPEETTEATTEPTTAPTTEPSTEPVEEFKLNRSDISFFKLDEEWTLYRGSVSLNQITWSSDDESIATFDKGVVKCVGAGITNVHAEYNGTKVSCIIRCRLPVETEPPTEPTLPDSEFPDADTTDVEISHTDVTIKGDESFNLLLLDKDDKPITVTWYVEKPDICTVSGNKVTGVKKGKSNVYCIYGEKMYICIVRVSSTSDGAVG